MKKKLSFLILPFIFTVSSYSQYRFEIGGEGGPSSDFYKIVDSGNNLETIPCASGFGGVIVRLNSKKKYFVEMGVLAKEYTIGLKLSQQSSYLTNNHFEILFVPLRFGYPLALSRKLSFTPHAGITPVIKTFKEGGSLNSNVETNSTGSLKYEYTSRAMNKNLFMLINGGAAVEWKFWRQLKFAAGINYYKGLTEVSVADVKYQINSEPEKSGQLVSEGSFLAYTFGIRYLLK